MKISSTEFQQNVGRYQDAALKEPVTITKNGRDHTVLVSADFFNAVLKGRVARRVEDLDEENHQGHRHRRSAGAVQAPR